MTNNTLGVRRPRRDILLGLFLLTIALTAAILIDIIATVFVAITVAYVLDPLSRWLHRRGFSRRIASLIATVVPIFAVSLILVPVSFMLYLRRNNILEFVQGLPASVSIEVFGFVYQIDASQVIDLGIQYSGQIAVEFAWETPVLIAKIAVFGFVVFGILVRRSELRNAILGPVPAEYQDIVLAIHERVQSTLYALYVIQAVTAVATFFIAAIVFWLLGYEFPITLAVIAGVLQFLPVVGPSILIIALGVWEVIVGAYLRSLLVVAVGLLLIALLPEIVIRPRIATETTKLPGSLYFVGFVGGVLSLGAIGIIAGPLVVSILVLLLSLLAREVQVNR